MSISAVAREAGVSTSTVSRFLKGELRLSAETEARIREAMTATGFSLPRRRVQHLALVIPELSNPYFAQLTQAVTDAAHHRDLEVSVLVSDGLEARERRIVAKCARGGGLGIDAVVFVSMTGSGALLAEVPDDFPFVTLDERLDGELTEHRSFVGADNFEGAYQATTFLLSRGHRRIAHVAGPGHLGSARDRLRGYLRAVRDAGLEVDPQLVLEGTYSEPFGAHALSRILRLEDRPTAVFAASDVVAVGMAAAAPMHGIRIPQDLSLVGFDGIEQGSWVTPRLSTVVQPLEEIARHALDLVDAANDGAEPTAHVLPMELRIAESVAAPPSAP
ncbi:LacI family DNA-binding transcriptional regulator [Brachybacterium fresconis]|uniref:LacI family transcriptional regulator/LacI family repressor for deo operon, udp, cdd, tsx, nupC, and nupG n=1 Tax=Brachybacterium fresconis TaxID=173363 RepID=A0ABS4YN06_9MICO|nr:LacI family DNA-binding transcriptional regulator [Brachybacterium fresconis]MBP2410185.1 LacI family transcriptional regulator/LacI family repressor for deo operon, udp, cdd, tsx, nupC, and nupG [Brachybacterium fresconis]